MMGFFKRKREMNQATLIQLRRIADSLECSNQDNKDTTNKELITQLNRKILRQKAKSFKI